MTKSENCTVTAVYKHWVIGENGLGFGAPTKHVFSDNHTEFTSDISEEFSWLLGLEWKYTASHSPHSNGSCERNSRQKVWNTCQGQGQGRQKCLARAIFTANTTTRDDTEFSPSHILLGRAPRLPCFLRTETDKEEHGKERTCHSSTPHNAREALLAIHETWV